MKQQQQYIRRSSSLLLLLLLLATSSFIRASSKPIQDNQQQPSLHQHSKDKKYSHLVSAASYLQLHADQSKHHAGPTPDADADDDDDAPPSQHTPDHHTYQKAPWFVPDTSSWYYMLYRRFNPFYKPPRLKTVIMRPRRADGSQGSPVEISIPISDGNTDESNDEDLKHPGLFTLNGYDMARATLFPRRRKREKKLDLISRFLADPFTAATQHHRAQHGQHDSSLLDDNDEENDNEENHYLDRGAALHEKQLPKQQPDNQWDDYNASDASPVVPYALSWMIDSDRMTGRALDRLLDIDVAREVAKLVAASYCNVDTLSHWNCTRCHDDFVLKRVVFDPLWDLLAFVGWSHTLDGIVVSFRGTDSRSYYNWAENMRTWRTDLALSYDGIPAHALVHGGFFYSYNSSYLAPNLTDAVAELVAEKKAKARGWHGGGDGGCWDIDDDNTRRTLLGIERGKRHRSSRGGTASSNSTVAAGNATSPTVFVSGHSLGGALATLCALDLKTTLNLTDVRVVSFGSPRVGNYVFAQWFEREIGPHWRFTHNRDIVPSLPPGYMGFYHVAQEVWVVDLFTGGKTIVGICDGSGEDPLCHNSVCHLGLCSSVADHLLYLSEMYTPHPDGC